MNDIKAKIKAHAAQADLGWGADYGPFGKAIEQHNLKVGVELGVAFGGHAESLLKVPTIDKLYGVDPYQHLPDYNDPLNMPQEEFDALYEFTLNRLAPFGDRYEHLRTLSTDAVSMVNQELDFVYIDADHSYKGVWQDLCVWFPKIRNGGIIGGHDYNHPDHQGVTTAVIEFFRRFDWEVNLGGNHVWWFEKRPLNISFFIPAYNCANIIQESIESIIQTNLEEGDEIVICNDGSSDNTAEVLAQLQSEYPVIKVVQHVRNKGGGAARNTAIENTSHPILFCLDNDNILAPNSIQPLKEYFLRTGADAASFEKLHFFQETPDKVTDIGGYDSGEVVTLADALSTPFVPGASGNYMFSKESWIRAGGCPHVFMDAWGFGLRQLATGSKMRTLPNSYYFHKTGHESAWVRGMEESNVALVALQVIIPFLHLIQEKDVDYILSRKHRYSWFLKLKEHPLKLKSTYKTSGPASNVIKPALYKRIQGKMRLIANNIRQRFVSK
jgi:glycosyltransferase involved in cell wall biosynthesis